MKRISKHTDDAFEKVIEMMQQDKDADLTDERKMPEEETKECQEVFQDLMDCKEALLREALAQQTDVDSEWKKFMNKNSISTTKVLSSSATKEVLPAPSYKKGWLWLSSFSIAASLLLTVWLLTSQEKSISPLVAFQAKNESQEIVLQTTKGEFIISEKDETSPKENLKAMGMTLLQDNEKEELLYDQLTTNSNIENHYLSIPRGKDFKLVLSDGSTVWLNAESSLSYPSQFTGNERRVILNGEAYFSVAHDEQHPFVVIANGVETRVLGTEFNVNSYSPKEANVTLIKGSIEVRKASKSTYTRVQPGENACIKADGSIHLKEVDTDKFVYWKEGYFYFDDVPLEQIMQELGRWYNVSVIFEHPELADIQLRYFCPRNKDIEHAVALLNRIQKCTLSLKENTIYVR